MTQFILSHDLTEKKKKHMDSLSLVDIVDPLKPQAFAWFTWRLKLPLLTKHILLALKTMFQICFKRKHSSVWQSSYMHMLKTSLNVLDIPHFSDMNFYISLLVYVRPPWSKRAPFSLSLCQTLTIC